MPNVGRWCSDDVTSVSRPETPATEARTTQRIAQTTASSVGLDAVLRLGHAGRVTGAVRAAEELAVDLDAVADDLAAAVLAHRCHVVDGALEAVEGVVRAGGDDFEGLVVVVATDLTARHRAPPGSTSGCGAASRRHASGEQLLALLGPLAALGLGLAEELGA